MAILGDNWIVIAIGVAAIAALAILIWLWWWVPKWQMHSVMAADPKARAEIEDNFRKTIGQALGGAAVLIGAGAAYLQFTQQQQASRDLLISNQVAKSFEQLGSKEAPIRLGGIYGLEGVMNTSEQYHQPVLEALCAFVRDSNIGIIDNVRLATDIQATLTVIGRPKPGRGRVNLIGANIPVATLFRADLTGATLVGANLAGAFLRIADLTNAELTGATLIDATLTDAKLGGAKLSGTNLSGANLTGVIGLTQQQLDQACGQPPKNLPNDLKWEAERPCY